MVGQVVVEILMVQEEVEYWGVEPVSYTHLDVYKRQEVVVQHIVPSLPVNERTPTATKQKYKYIALVVLLVVLAGVGFWVRHISKEADNSIAVLPFKSNGDSEAALLAEGVTEQIHASLTTLSHLKVISQNSLELFKDCLLYTSRCV